MAGLGLLASEPVHWLLSNESEVKRRIESFIRGELGPSFDVAGPPDDETLIKLKTSGPNGAVPLPCVRLNLKMQNTINGKACAVTCSDNDTYTILDWQRRDYIRRRLELQRGKSWAQDA